MEPLNSAPSGRKRISWANLKGIGNHQVIKENASLRVKYTADVSIRFITVTLFPRLLFPIDLHRETVAFDINFPVG